MKKWFAMLLALCLMCGLVRVGAEDADTSFGVDSVVFDSLLIENMNKLLVYEDEETGCTNQLVIFEQSGNLGQIIICCVRNERRTAQYSDRYIECPFDESGSEISYEDYLRNRGFYKSLITIASDYQAVAWLFDEFNIVYESHNVCGEAILFDNQQISIKEGNMIILFEDHTQEGDGYGFGFGYGGAGYSVMFTNIEDDDKAIEEIKEFVRNIHPVNVSATVEKAADQQSESAKSVTDNENVSEDQAQKDKKRIVITGDSAKIRSEASISSGLIRTVYKGEIFPCEGESGDFYIIEIDGRTGYVHKGVATIQ